MMSRASLAKLLRFLQVSLDAAAGAVLAAIVAVVLWGVFTRFALSAASWWTDEAARLLLVWLTMLGAAAASGRSEHLGVDFFAKRLHPDAQRAVALIVEIVVIAFAVFVLIYGGAILVVETLRAGQKTPAIGLSMGWVYLAAPIAGAGVALFSFGRIVRADAAASGSGDEATG